MEKIYLKYDDIRPCVECDYGFVKEILFMGFMYPYKKGDLRFFSIMLALQLAVCVLLIILFPIPILYKLLNCIAMILIINFLFACNYRRILL